MNRGSISNNDKSVLSVSVQIKLSVLVDWFNVSNIIGFTLFLSLHDCNKYSWSGLNVLLSIRVSTGVTVASFRLLDKNYLPSKCCTGLAATQLIGMCGEDIKVSKSVLKFICNLPLQLQNWFRYLRFVSLFSLVQNRNPQVWFCDWEVNDRHPRLIRKYLSCCYVHIYYIFSVALHTLIWINSKIFKWIGSTMPRILFKKIQARCGFKSLVLLLHILFKNCVCINIYMNIKSLLYYNVLAEPSQVFLQIL